VAYVMTSMMEGVLNYGTGYEVRRMGFRGPAAGKTGTSHDAWFAGYTNNLLCIAWVGYDDYSDLRLSGAQSAAPIWAEFMKKATQLPEYRDVQGFPQPAGVVDVQLDKTTNLISTPACPAAVNVAFIAGTEPQMTCEQAGVDPSLLQDPNALPNLGEPGVPPDPNGRPVPRSQPIQQLNGQQPAQEQKKKGFFGKLVGVFSNNDQQQQPPK
jgi:penicillin-binding protein 1B